MNSLPLAPIVALLVVFALGKIIGTVLDVWLREEARAWPPLLLVWLVRLSAKLIPASSRERYRNDWLVDTAQYNGRPLKGISWALGCFPAAWREGRALRSQARGKELEIRESVDVVHAVRRPVLPPPPVPLPTAEILGIPLAVSDYEQVLDWMEAMVAADAPGYMTVAAVNLVMSAQEQPETLAAVRGATLTVPEGMPLVWALHALGHPGATRVYAPDLMALFCERAAREGLPIYLYGGRHDDRARELLVRRLEERFPGLEITGASSPPFRPLTETEEGHELELINASGAAVVWVGTGQPRQEQWMHRVRPRLKPPLLVGVGAAFDFHAGLISQAPPWMQRNGLEWSYRLSHEPRRLWRRYARYNPLFVAGFAHQYARYRRERS